MGVERCARRRLIAAVTSCISPVDVSVLLLVVVTSARHMAWDARTDSSGRPMYRDDDRRRRIRSCRSGRALQRAERQARVARGVDTAKATRVAKTPANDENHAIGCMDFGLRRRAHPDGYPSRQDDLIVAGFPPHEFERGGCARGRSRLLSGPVLDPLATVLLQAAGQVKSGRSADCAQGSRLRRRDRGHLADPGLKPRQDQAERPSAHPRS